MLGIDLSQIGSLSICVTVQWFSHLLLSYLAVVITSSKPGLNFFLGDSILLNSGSARLRDMMLINYRFIQMTFEPDKHQRKSDSEGTILHSCCIYDRNWMRHWKDLEALQTRSILDFDMNGSQYLSLRPKKPAFKIASLQLMNTSHMLKSHSISDYHKYVKLLDDLHRLHLIVLNLLKCADFQDL